MARISKSRKRTHSIMSNGGFGILTITRGEYSIQVPEDWLFEDGRIKKYAIKKVDLMFKKAENFSKIEEAQNA